MTGPHTFWQCCKSLWALVNARTIGCGGASAVSLVLMSCAAPAAKTPLLTTIQNDMANHIAVLASDEFEGRRPGTEGEGKTLRYLSTSLGHYGLVSGTNDPTHPWFAPVDLVQRTPVNSTITVKSKGKDAMLLSNGVALFTTGQRSLVEDAELVYVGTSSRAADNAKLRGKVAVMRFDHPERRAQRAALMDSGAVAVLALVPDDATFADITRAREGGGYALASRGAGGAHLDGYISRTTAENIFGAERVSGWLMHSEASDAPIERTGLTASIEVVSRPGTVRTHNLIAKLPGKDPAAGVVMLIAHWDHFGTCDASTGSDKKQEICNGAVDNASGLAVMLELAKYLANGESLDRDVYFLATTGEEWGLLGAERFVNAPAVPLNDIVAAFNLDTVAVAPANSRVGVVGDEGSAFDAEIDRIIARSGRIKGEREFAKTLLRRQDGWVFAQKGVPVRLISNAVGEPEILKSFMSSRYHHASDDIVGIELGGAAQDVLLHLNLIRHFASKSDYPR